jgi:hypothetical protein
MKGSVILFGIMFWLADLHDYWLEKLAGIAEAQA